jgi:hypothetical protein
MINAYGSPKTIGSRETTKILQGPVVVQEKIDGSQFSFGLRGWQLEVRSKGAMMVAAAAPGLFSGAINTAIRVAPDLIEGAVYRGEAVQRPRHNVLIYSRVPVGNFVLFDVELPDGSFMNSMELAWEANRLALECVPVLYEGLMQTPADLRQFLNTTSLLGGAMIEGVVVKNYTQGTNAKLVSETFKESRVGAIRGTDRSATKLTAIQEVIARYTTSARWQKALIHLREQGVIGDSASDIPALIREIQADVLKDHEEDIKKALFDAAWREIRSGIVRGMPEWYKNRLLEASFEAPKVNDGPV